MRKFKIAALVVVVLFATLLIVADHDIPTVEHVQAMQRALPDAHLEVVPDATHGLPMEKPDVVARLVLDFLKSKSPPAIHVSGA